MKEIQMLLTGTVPEDFSNTVNSHLMNGGWLVYPSTLRMERGNCSALLRKYVEQPSEGYGDKRGPRRDMRSRLLERLNANQEQDQ